MKTDLKLRLTFLLFAFCLSSFSLYSQNKNLRTNRYAVVINHEEQYSILPANRAIPKGWTKTRVSGTLIQCQKYIEEVWTDMRPLSIKKLNPPRDTRYAVIINHEEQYSIWFANRELPRGWKKTRINGSLSKCQKYIEEVWTDMRPLSIRK